MDYINIYTFSVLVLFSPAIRWSITSLFHGLDYSLFQDSLFQVLDYSIFYGPMVLQSYSYDRVVM